MKKVVVLAMVLMAVFAAQAFALAPIKPEDQKPVFIYVGPVADGGYNYMHDLGRKLMEKENPGIKSSIVESVPEGPDAERVMETAIRKGAKVIYANSFGFMDPMVNVAKKYPDVYFNHCSGYKTAPNMSTYFGRMYQPRYLSGIVAGKATKSNNIGYVAAYPIPEVIRGINAFTLGVQSVNPEATVRVVWTKTWYDPAKEKEAAKSLLDVGADVIAQHQDSPGPQEAAQERGVYSIGYNTDMSRFAPKAHLTAPVWNWTPYYRQVVEQVQKSTWKPSSDWPGLAEGVVDLAPFGPMVPPAVRERVQARRAEIVAGRERVFAGPIADQQGTVRIPADAVATDQELLGMNWFVQGVVGTTE